MKRILLLLHILCSLTALAQKPIYVYFNDGSFKAFLSSEVDHISLAPTNGDPESEMYVQEIWTVDSVYRYPVYTIDSISSYIPPTKFQAGAIDLSGDLLQWVISADTTHVYLRPDTPTQLIPQAGQKLGYPKIDDIFPYGFAGEVKRVSQDEAAITVDCTPVWPSLVFETLYLVTRSRGYDMNQAARKAQAGSNDQDGIVRKHFDLPTKTIDFSAEMSKIISIQDDLSGIGGISSSVTTSNSVDITLFIVVNSWVNRVAQVTISGTHDVESTTSVYGGVNGHIDWPLRSLKKEFPIGYGFYFYILPGGFADASCTISGSWTSTKQYKSHGSYEFSTLGKVSETDRFTVEPVSSESNMSMTLDGRFAIGAYLEGGIAFWDEKYDHVALRAEAGLELTGSAVLLKSDIENSTKSTAVYQKMKNSTVRLTPFVATHLSMGLGTNTSNLSFNWQRSKYPPTWSRQLVPTFSNTSLNHSAEQLNSLVGSVKVSGACMSPLPIGFILFDKNNDVRAKYDFPAYYNGSPTSYTHTFDLADRGRFTLYPVVTFLGIPLLASPSSEDEVKSPVPVITSADQVKSYHSEEGFAFGGASYEYMFEVSMKATAESLDDVADWGFVYTDASGQEVPVSLKSQGNSGSYNYSLYSQQRVLNTAIYSYIQYTDSQKDYGEPYAFVLEYPEEPEEPEVYLICPDHMHPHLIDLGLPSGTKWACCNVGAQAPEEFGSFYAWGETTTKTKYTWSNYIFSDASVTTDRVTKYNFWSKWGPVDRKSTLDPEDDAATVNWGDEWCMPTEKQCEELRDSRYTTSQWTSQNGVGGYLITSKTNGASIFLPAAGSYDGTTLKGVGEKGEYWTSTLYTDGYEYNGKLLLGPFTAYYMYFNNTNIRWYEKSREWGKTVRPIGK